MSLLFLLRVGVFLTGLMIAGEALALLVGMHILSERGNPWISFKNDLLLGVDVVTGVGMIFVATVTGEMGQADVVYGILFLALLAHGYREWEYFVNAADKFCANLPLFVFNNIKLAGLWIVTAIALALKFG